MSAAKACVDEDGAEVIIPGCTLAGSVLTHDLPDAESVIGAPVLDGMVTGFKMAEMMADMRAAGVPTVSRRGWFEKPPKADMRTLRRLHGEGLLVPFLHWGKPRLLTANVVPQMNDHRLSRPSFRRRPESRVSVPQHNCCIIGGKHLLKELRSAP